VLPPDDSALDPAAEVRPPEGDLGGREAVDAVAEGVEPVTPVPFS
jgi:hypothetical protein